VHRRIGANFTFLILTDRDDLDSQIYKTFAGCRVALPNLTGPNALVEAQAKFTHEVLSKLVIGAVALHVTGALKHHFIDHDGVLSRMLPFGAGIAPATQLLKELIEV
jgi:hypothetical protein